MEVIKPIDLQLGNFINCFGGTVIVTGITPRPDGTFFIHHSGDNQVNNPFGEGIVFDAYPIDLTGDWKEALRVDKYIFPEWIKYVHQAQNYMRWFVGIELLHDINWSMVGGFDFQFIYLLLPGFAF